MVFMHIRGSIGKWGGIARVWGRLELNMDNWVDMDASFSLNKGVS